MSTKTIFTLIVVAVLVVLGGYLLMRSSAGNTMTATSTSQTASTTTEQVQGQDVKVGSGKEAKRGDTVSVLYVGKFADGTVFDSSAAHGNEPITFVLGASQGAIVPIVGFQIGVNGMKEGGERLLAIPPSLAYGSSDLKDPTGKTLIPGNSTLVFDVQLVKVVSATTTAQ